MAHGGSTLLIDEYFEAGDERFLDAVLASSADKKLYAFGKRWLGDSREWARAMLLRYIDDGCDRPGHRGLVRQVLRGAEERADDEVMAHLLVAFDRLVVHRIKVKRRWDYGTNQAWTEHRKIRAMLVPVRYTPSRRKTAERFSVYTRQHLQRRALRYFRLLGYRDADRFGKAARTALLLYRDEHVSTPEQLTDAWGLMHLLYHGSPVIVRHPRGVRVADGSALEDLQPAPLHPQVWRGCFAELMTMLAVAPCLVVRRWIAAWLRSAYEEELRAPEMRRIERLLWSPYEDVQTFGSDLLERAKGLETLPVAQWLALLDIESSAALPIVCRLIEKHVSPDRLDLAQCVALACSGVASVAELGLRWLRDKKVDGPDALRAVLQLTEARCRTVRGEAVAWLVALIARPGLGEAVHVRDMIDARHADVRKGGMALLEGEKRFQDDTELWAALVESPYADVRAFLIRHLESRLGALSEGGIRHVWATTLLSVSRGSRAKRMVLRQLAERIAAHPSKANDLLPVLAIALRSVREPERRAALAALGRAVFRTPSLREAVGRHLSELQLFSEGAS